jgi:hypothetical protein
MRDVRSLILVISVSGGRRKTHAHTHTRPHAHTHRVAHTGRLHVDLHPSLHAHTRTRTRTHAHSHAHARPSFRARRRLEADGRGGEAARLGATGHIGHPGQARSKKRQLRSARTGEAAVFRRPPHPNRPPHPKEPVVSGPSHMGPAGFAGECGPGPARVAPSPVRPSSGR